MSVTARATIQGALKLIGVLDPAETMSADDASDGLTMLNNMADAWNLERLNIYTISEVVATFAGASATIGPGMQIDTARPVRVESAFYRRSGIDYPLAIISSEEYDKIGMKNVSGDYPEVLHYNANSPTGVVYVWPVPSANEYHFSVQKQLTEFADLDEVHTLPQGYQKAMMYALAVELAPLYRLEAPASIIRIAINMMRILKRANVVVPKLSVSLPSNSAETGRINILSNQ